MLNLVKRLWKEEAGQGMVEYGLILALVSIVVIAVLLNVGEGLKGIFEKVESELEVPEGS